MYKSFVLLISMLCVVNGGSISSQIVNKNVERRIDLTSQLVKVTATITLENRGSQDVTNFFIACEPGVETNYSYVVVTDASKEKLSLEVDSVGDLHGYNVKFSIPLYPGQTAVVVLEYVLTKVLVPYPNTITQKERQLVRYFGSHYFYTPYITVQQTTSVILPSKNVESYTKLEPVSFTEAVINYGPYSNIKDLTFDRMVIHFENHMPFLTVTRLERTIEISHWGNIAVEENIEILHTGAKLKSSFSRYDYERDQSQNHHSVKSYRTILPSAAHNIYYRDSNGNISTSVVHPRKDWIELELRPRFPLFGGWRSLYTLGYNVPSYQYLYKLSGGRYLLRMRLIDHVFDDMHVEEIVTSIVLPVGVEDVQLSFPYEVNLLPEKVVHTYLDSVGRRILRMTKKNLVEYHIQDIELYYKWEPYLLLHKPVCIITAFMLLFLAVVVYVRLDFSILKQEHVKKRKF